MLSIQQAQEVAKSVSAPWDDPHAEYADRDL